jgi:hypothetical protein
MLSAAIHTPVDSKQLPDRRCRSWPRKHSGQNREVQALKRNSCSQWGGTNPIQVAQHLLGGVAENLRKGSHTHPGTRNRFASKSGLSFTGSLFSATGERPRIKSPIDSFSRCNCAVFEHTEDATARLGSLCAISDRLPSNDRQLGTSANK